MNRDDANHLTAAAFAAPAAVDRLQKIALIVGGVGAVALVVGFFLSREYALRAYLLGWVYWAGVALGCLAIYLLHNTSRGAWGLVIRRVNEAASRTLPLLFVLFIPVLFGIRYIYLWARPEAVAADHLLQVKEPYLNVTFYAVRWVLYFLIWIGFALLLNRLSRRQDETADPGLVGKMRLFSAFGLAAYCLAVTFAAVDWLMSLEPHWFSTIYGVYLMGSQGLSALAFLIVFAAFLYRREPMSGVLQPRHFHDWGKLLFAFVMLWSYFSFSQFLIIWSGNLPEEIDWYLHRTHGGWGYVAVTVVLFHFALPFVLLLSRDLKRRAGLLAWVAVMMLVMRWVDLVWQVEPSFHEPHFSSNPAFYWLYLAAPAAIGGLWFFFFLRELKKRPLLPINDPFLPEAIAHEH